MAEQQKNAPGAWRGVEGEDQNTNSQGGEPIIMTSIQQNAMIREWAEAWAAKRAELEAELTVREDFQVWAAERIAQRSWTMAGCIARILDQKDWQAQLPPFPKGAAPTWVREVDDSLSMGGEVTVMLYGTEHRRGKSTARMRWGLNVVVGPNGNNVPSGVDEPIGTIAWFEGGPDVTIDHFAEGSWRETANAAKVLRELADEMQAASYEEMSA
ncbi:hypothetical protein J7E68_06465 [Microbacterium sp. ISL-103]|uniref:hypothetical protein n=1 Tax=Microbacterium sp. ISL-103 TaxID=2819156 RepID=UPI001BE8EB93|nr:hypothetical protein [Microbacterium sp. ISL-103]MBT2474229.1 hypothetical protein [Microbacterium sp. ISL-103]